MRTAAHEMIDSNREFLLTNPRPAEALDELMKDFEENPLKLKTICKHSRTAESKRRRTFNRPSKSRVCMNAPSAWRRSLAMMSW